ncbi:hypothetical protein VPHK327_0031 [Vibrio phage K327]
MKENLIFWRLRCKSAAKPSAENPRLKSRQTVTNLQHSKTAIENHLIGVFILIGQLQAVNPLK